MSDQGDNAFSMIIRSSIWATPPVCDEPEILLERWRVIEVLDGPREGERHLVGRNAEYPEGRVSSALQGFDLATGRGTTRSGRAYVLVGPSSYDTDAQWVWEWWRDKHNVTEVRDVSVEYAARPEQQRLAPVLDGAERLELSQLVADVFDVWAMEDEQRYQILGVAIEQGSPLPPDPDIIDRALEIARIYECLHSTNLDRPDLADAWPALPSAALGGRTPIEVMSVEGPAFVRLLLQVEWI